MNQVDNNWLIVAGKIDKDLALALTESVQARIIAGEYKERDVEYVSKLTRPVINEKLNISPERLRKLRTLCQLWDIDIKATKITSHRKILGPIIVGVKKALLPVIRMLLKDTINQQRDYNAAVISLLTDISNDIEKRK